jgi:hypothetical protein
VGFLVVLDALGERLRAQPELQQDDSMAYMQGSRAAGCGWICVPGELDESQHQQSGDEKEAPVSKPTTLRLLMSYTLTLYGQSWEEELPSPPHFTRLFQPVPEQMCEPACRRGPQEVGQCVEIPDVELVVEGAAEADANEVGSEEGRNNLYVMVKAKGRNRSGRSWG